ncbi:MAG: hypothetical protein Q9225_000293 [Loekoesia sp. 1 TL-2023]
MADIAIPAGHHRQRPVGQKSSSIPYLREILLEIIQLDLWIPIISAAASKDHDNTLFKLGESKRIVALLPETKVIKWDDFDGTEEQIAVIRDYVEGMSEKEVLERTKDLATRAYIPRAFEQCINSYGMKLQAMKSVGLTPNFTPPPRLLRERKIEASQYGEFCRSELNLARTRLRALVNLTLQYDQKLIEAINNSSLDDDVRNSLKLRMESMTVHIDEASQLLNIPLKLESVEIPQKTLPRSTGFVSLDFEDRQQTGPDHAAAQNRLKALANLNVLVYITYLLAVIPIAIAWTHSPHRKGDRHDAAFWQLISGSSTQILGLATMMVSTFYNVRLIREAWFWTYVLAGSSATCAVIAIPFYFSLHTEYSMVMSFAAGALLNCVTLQLMLVK